MDIFSLSTLTCFIGLCLELTVAVTWSSSTASATLTECDYMGSTIPYTATVNSFTGTLSYSLVSQSPNTTPKMFAVDSGSGGLTSNSNSFHASFTSSYTVVIRATDTVNSADVTVTVTLVECANNFSPVFFGMKVLIAGGELESTTLVESMTRDDDTDSPSNTIASYAIISGNNEGYFTISDSGSISVSDGKRLPTQSGSSFGLIITATDGGKSAGAKTGTFTVSICVSSCPTSTGITAYSALWFKYFITLVTFVMSP